MIQNTFLSYVIDTVSYINTTHGQFILWKLLYLVKEKGNHHWQAILRATNKKLVLSFRVFLRMFWSVFGDVAHDRSQNPYLSAPRNTSYSLPLPVRNKCPTKFQRNKCECCCHRHVWKQQHLHELKMHRVKSSKPFILELCHLQLPLGQ